MDGEAFDETVSALIRTLGYRPETMDTMTRKFVCDYLGKQGGADASSVARNELHRVSMIQTANQITTEKDNDQSAELQCSTDQSQSLATSATSERKKKSKFHLFSNLFGPKTATPVCNPVAPPSVLPPPASAPPPPPPPPPPVDLLTVNRQPLEKAKNSDLSENEQELLPLVPSADDNLMSQIQKGVELRKVYCVCGPLHC